MTAKELDELDAAIAVGVMGWERTKLRVQSRHGRHGWSIQDCWCIINADGNPELAVQCRYFSPTRNKADFLTAWMKAVSGYDAHIYHSSKGFWQVEIGAPFRDTPSENDDLFIAGCECMRKAVSE